MKPTPYLFVLALGACSMDNPAFDPRGGLGGDESSESGARMESETSGQSGDGDEPGDGDGDEPGDGDGDGPGDGDGDEPGDGDGDEALICDAPAVYADCDSEGEQLTTNPLRALGLGCPGPAAETMAVNNTSFTVLDPNSWRIASHFGTAEDPNTGEWLWSARAAEVLEPGDGLPDIPPNTSDAILILSTGLLPPLTPNGGVVLAPGAQAQSNNNANEGALGFPAPISADYGSNSGQGGDPFVDCDGSNDCSDSLFDQWYSGDVENSLHDQLWLSFELVVPPGVNGYMFDFAFFSAEYPAYIGTKFNDMFIAWSSSPSYTGTLTFIDESPMNTTSLDAIGGFAYIGEDPALAGTGFEGHAGTDWLLARGPATPGQELEITLYVTDLGDTLGGSVVLLDNFRWDCGGCDGPDCGFNP